MSNYLAFWLRFDGEIPPYAVGLCIQTLPVLLFIRGLSFLPFRLYGGLWRYTSVRDLLNIIGGVTSSSVVFYLIIHWGFSLTRYPRSVFLVDTLILIFLMGGIRLTRRLHRELGRLDCQKRLLIYGAGDAGEMIVRELRHNPAYDYEPVGYLDDNLAKIGQHIHGIKVLGTRASLASVVEDKHPHAVLIAMPTATSSAIRDIVKSLEPFRIPIMTLPNLKEILEGSLPASHIRNLQVEDLLDRVPVNLDREPVRSLLQGRAVLVTGAGGSIGSELCRQIIKCHPSTLILYDRYENGLYTIACELSSSEYRVVIIPAIGDITDETRLNQVMLEYRPAIVFHAAAHKHVPLMEQNPCEAIKNNVRGTRLVIEAAARAATHRIIIISTDKAVNPTSVMGASKRTAEILVQYLSRTTGISCAIVRFGNVLGSNGSAVPYFLDQIRSGGPVTVTHPDMRRYFMLIPEAVQLVLHAATLTKGCDTFVLEMGEQIKVLDMAKNLILLSGHTPDEISITFTGIRPGEKLFEELVGPDESVEPSDVPNIRLVRSTVDLDFGAIADLLIQLEQMAVQGKTESALTLLSQLVPSYRPSQDLTASFPDQTSIKKT